MGVNWRGVFPAATTEFRPDQALEVFLTKLADEVGAAPT